MDSRQSSEDRRLIQLPSEDHSDVVTRLAGKSARLWTRRSTLLNRLRSLLNSTKVAVNSCAGDSWKKGQNNKPDCEIKKEQETQWAIPEVCVQVWVSLLSGLSLQGLRVIIWGWTQVSGGRSKDLIPPSHYLCC